MNDIIKSVYLQKCNQNNDGYGVGSHIYIFKNNTINVWALAAAFIWDYRNE
jgi:hypothetical protein